MKKLVGIFGIVIVTSLTLCGQTANNMVVEMIKYSAEELQNEQPEDKEDQIIEHATPFIPVEGEVDDEMIDKYTSSLSDQITLKLISSGYALVGNKQYPEVQVKLSANYENYPDYRSANGWVEITSVKNSEGESLLMNDATYDQYVELGIIDEGFNYPIPGNLEEDLYLKEEPDWSVPLQVQGKLHLSCPAAYEAISFSKADVGKTKEIAGHKITLLSMEKNQAVYRVDNVQQFSNIKQLYLNKDKKPFQANGHIGVPSEIYDAVQQNKGALSDEKVHEIASGYDPQNISSKVYVAEVSGNCHYVAFYKVTSTSDHVVLFNLKRIAEMSW